MIKLVSKKNNWERVFKGCTHCSCDCDSPPCSGDWTALGAIAGGSLGAHVAAIA